VSSFEWAFDKNQFGASPPHFGNALLKISGDVAGLIAREGDHHGDARQRNSGGRSGLGARDEKLLSRPKIAEGRQLREKNRLHSGRNQWDAESASGFPIGFSHHFEMREIQQDW